MNWLYQITQYASGAALPANSAHCQRNWLYMSRVVLATYSAHCCSTLLCIQYVRGRTVKKKRTLSRNWCITLICIYQGPYSQQIAHTVNDGLFPITQGSHCQQNAHSVQTLAVSDYCTCTSYYVHISQGLYCQQITLALSKIGCITLLCICQGPYYRQI